MKIDDLIKVEGVVRTIQIEEESDSKGRINLMFYVYLKNGERFKIMDDKLFEDYRRIIQTKVKPGNNVVMYRRTQQQTNFGLGTLNLIYQLEYEGEVLMPLSVMKRNFKGLMVFELVILAILSTVQMLRMKKRNTDNKV